MKKTLELGEFPEPKTRPLARAIGFFLFGALLGTLPAIMILALVDECTEAIRLLVLHVVAVFGLVFALVGVCTRGKFFVPLMKFLGQDARY